MITVDGQPDWRADAPLKARQAIIVAAEAAAYGRGDVTLNVVLDAEADPAWLRITAVRTLASLVAGPYASRLWAQLRQDAHALAAETRADDRSVRGSLVSIALAEAYERGAIGRCEQLARSSEFSDREISYATSLLVGHTAYLLTGQQTSEFFARLRYRNGLAAS